jgi:glutathione S-transferase
MGDDLVFYTNPHSRGRMVRWMLEEVGAPYRTVEVAYGEAMKAPEYLAINPMGKVPALVHHGNIVTECAAICAYLADAFPTAGLAPPQDERAAYYRWLFFAAGPLEAALVNKALGVEVPAERRAMVGYGDLDTVLGAIEAALQKDAYLCGSHFSAADVYLGSSLAFALQFNGIEAREAFSTYVSRITDREAYRRANELDGPMG